MDRIWKASKFSETLVSIKGPASAIPPHPLLPDACVPGPPRGHKLPLGQKNEDPNTYRDDNFLFAEVAGTSNNSGG